MFMSPDKEPQNPPAPGSSNTKESDRRAEFAQRSTEHVSPEAERAFIKARLDMIRNNRSLAKREKQLAIQELESRLRAINEPKKSATEK